MDFKNRLVEARGERISIEVDGQEVARAYLYVLSNDLHPNEPFGLLEDVFVDDKFRERGLATQLVRKVIEGAKQAGCYKLIATSRDTRPRVHKLYEELGFENWGREFRMNFAGEPES